jgi:hypothetical protein
VLIFIIILPSTISVSMSFFFLKKKKKKSRSLVPTLLQRGGPSSSFWRAARYLHLRRFKSMMGLKYSQVYTFSFFFFSTIEEEEDDGCAMDKKEKKQQQQQNTPPPKKKGTGYCVLFASQK